MKIKINEPVKKEPEIEKTDQEIIFELRDRISFLSNELSYMCRNRNEPFCHINGGECTIPNADHEAHMKCLREMNIKIN